MAVSYARYRSVLVHHHLPLQTISDAQVFDGNYRYDTYYADYYVEYSTMARANAIGTVPIACARAKFLSSVLERA